MRLRIRFSKLGKIRFTSQRDVARMWERAIRRAGLPIAYTAGFSPRPQLAFGLALPTGCESLAEYVDVVLDDRGSAEASFDASAVGARLGRFLPDGLAVQAVAAVEGRIASVQQDVTSCQWDMSFLGLSRDELGDRIERLLGARSVLIVRERKGREEIDDLRPSIVAITLADGGSDADPDGGQGAVGLVAELSTRPRGVRPVEMIRGLVAVAAGGDGVGGVVAAAAGGGGFGAGPSARAGAGGGSGLVLERACRTKQWIERDGVRREPLAVRDNPVGSGRDVHAMERAS